MRTKPPDDALASEYVGLNATLTELDTNVKMNYWSLVTAADEWDGSGLRWWVHGGDDDDDDGREAESRAEGCLGGKRGGGSLEGTVESEQGSERRLR